MNIRDIEYMWKVATNNPNQDTNWHDEAVIKFAQLIAAAERKEWAKEFAGMGEWTAVHMLEARDQ